jgi:Tol biopolymer transport system component
MLGIMKVSHILICLVSLSLFAIPVSADLNIVNTSVISTGDIKPPWSPAWSPDGNSIAYIAYDASNNQQIFTINIDGSGKKQVTSDTIYITKKWAATWLDEDISFLSFAPPANLETIYLVHPDGTDERKLLDDNTRQGRSPDKPPFVGGASWNPVKKQILYISLDSVTSLEKVFEVNLDGTGKRQVINDQTRHWAPSWSPDGNSFVYVSYDSNGIEQLYTVNADGTGKTQITFDGIKKSDPNWGQGGIIYVSYENRTSSGSNIFLINPGGTRQELLPEDGFRQENPRWSRDGSKILYDDIDLQGNLSFKVLYLQTQAAVTATPSPTPTLKTTAPPTGTTTPTPTAAVTPIETPAAGALKNVVYSMLLVLGIIIVVMLAILLISNILSRKK